MKKMKTCAKWLMIIPLVFLLASCQKINEKDFPLVSQHDNTYDKVMLKVGEGEGSYSANGDTAYVLPNMQVNVRLEGLPVLPAGVDYHYIWTLGDGSTTLTTPGVEHAYRLGTYQLTVSATNPQSGVIITRSIWVVSSERTYQDAALILISAKAVSGGYDYEFGFLSTTIYNFKNPPYTTNKWIPFVTGTFCSWPTPAPPAPDYVTINNLVYIVKHVVSGNSVMQEFQFGQDGNWSYHPTSKYWISTGTGEGKYRVYTNGGHIYASTQNYVYVPGDNGDSINAVFPPTIRDSIILGSDPKIRIFVNYKNYAEGSQPFLNYKKFGTWSNSALIIISGTDWGYYDLHINDFSADNNRIYFRFGPNISSPSTYGEMKHSKFFFDNMLAMQIASMKKSAKQYIVSPLQN